jgi:hypothetical protein
MKSAKGGFKNIYAVRIEPGEDLLEGLNYFCKERNLKHGVIISGLGSLNGASFFDPEEIPGQPGKYGYVNPIEMEGAIELVGISGIICEDDDGGISLHVHYSIADKKGNCFAGHVNKGNRVFVTADIIIGEIEGIFMGRMIDPVLNLPLFSPQQL